VNLLHSKCDRCCSLSEKIWAVNWFAFAWDFFKLYTSMAFLVHIHVLRRNDPTSLTITPKTKLINWVYANFQTKGIYILGANGTNLCSIAQLYYSDRPLIDFSSPVTQRTCVTNKSAQESHAPLNLLCFLCLCSTTASHRVSESRSWCNANIHVLCQWRQAGESWSHGRKHRGNVL